MSVINTNDAEVDLLTHSFLSFKLDDELFAVDVQKVIEIKADPTRALKNPFKYIIEHSEHS